MKNIELLNFCYKFFNRFITANELVEKLETMDKKEDRKEIDDLIKEIKEVIDKTSNEEDDFVIDKRKNIKRLITKFADVSKDNDNQEFLNKQIESLKKDYERKIDSQERWFAVTDCIDKNEYFNKNFESLSDYELLEFIAQNIKAPFPPQLSQEEFDKLVKVGIEKDQREWLWRLAFNYDNGKINLDEIANYFIKVKDPFYLAELISAVGGCLNIDNLINKIDDKELIKELIERKGVISANVTKEQLNKLMSKLGE